MSGQPLCRLPKEVSLTFLAMNRERVISRVKAAMILRHYSRLQG
jgi:hypothetical protein